MEISVAWQAVQFCASVAAGAALGLVYDLFRTLRRRTKTAAAQFFDLLFWALAAFGLFVLGMSVGEGELRLFMLAGALGGILLYLYSVSRAVLAVFGFFADALSEALHICAAPLVRAGKGLKKAGIFLKNLFPKRKRWFTIMRHSRIAESKERTRTEVDQSEAQTRKYLY